MQPIYPICAESCRPYIGQQVCAVLHDGTQVVGTLDNVSGQGLFINQGFNNATVLSTKPGKVKKELKVIKNKAQTSAWGFGGFNPLLWSSIALLFLLPFFFI
ncbi:hypothetical protein BC351_11655 [Paenibacillus ferrarius]|uniref:Uncharacterized protein n=1 Tax=Paenibacillus ferrarius TaxID=1469647 RepID=A0A1V4H7P3_9BACL|nr:hypothetical protein [Paenibacillus ferrarius]OPH47154.1 hypothetical protein BC351_11655 [Paenibacillus ferrarius]